MSKWANSKVEDYGLDYLRQNTTRIVACQGQPTSYADAATPVATGKLLGSLTGIVPASWTLGNDPTTGRRLTLASETIPIGYAGTLDHIALVNDAVPELLYTLPVTVPQAVVGGNTVTTPDISITIQNPI